MSETMTITEALAEVKLTLKKVTSDQAFIREHLVRQASLVDPLEKSGGSVEQVKRRTQGIRDMYERLVRIRSAIQESNRNTSLVINGVNRTIAEWLIWKREVAEQYRGILTNMSNTINSERRAVGRTTATQVAVDLIVHLEEPALADEMKFLEETLGVLDGKLSLLNATTTITF